MKYKSVKHTILLVNLPIYDNHKHYKCSPQTWVLGEHYLSGIYVFQIYQRYVLQFVHSVIIAQLNVMYKYVRTKRNVP